MFTHGTVHIHWLGHDGFLIEGKDVRIVIDPFKVVSPMPVDFVLITHEHYDHLSIADIRKFIGDETVVVCPRGCERALFGIPRILTMVPGQEIPLGTANLKSVPAYNTNKYRDVATKIVFHPKADGKLGFLLDVDGIALYHAGDTDVIPEMEGMNVDIALLPVSGTYVMSAEEAVEAAKIIKPKIAIPMHYGSIVGTEADAKRFAELLDGSGIRVEILKVG